MAGWGEADQASHPVLHTAGEDSSVFGSLALAALERLTPQEIERACFGKLRDPAAAEEVRLPSRPESAGLARRLVLSVMQSWDLHAQLEKAELLTGELVANAVRHAGGRTIGLRLVRRPGWLRVEVRDSSRALPCLIVSADLPTAGVRTCCPAARASGSNSASANAEPRPAQLSDGTSTPLARWEFVRCLAW
jgi:hypothetical protein